MVDDKDDAAQVDAGPTDLRRVDEYLLGDTQRFGEIDGWIRQVLGSCYPALASDHDDLTQIIHEKLLVNLRADRFERRASLRGYIRSITHNTAIDRLRRLYQERDRIGSLQSDPEADWGNPYRALESLDETQLTHKALMALPASCRELWNLVFVERLSYDDVAKRLSIPPGTVKSRMWHCRRKAISAVRRLRLTTRS